MKAQTWFETDLGYAATKEKLLKSKDFIGDQSGDNRGRLTFHFKGLKDFTVQITTNGKIGITYPETANYNVAMERLKPYLVRADKTPVKTITLKYKAQNVSRNFKMSAGFFERWRLAGIERERLRYEQTERNILRLEREDAALTEIMMLNESDPNFLKKEIAIKRKYRLL